MHLAWKAKPARRLALAVLLGGCLGLLLECSRKGDSGREIWAQVDGQPIYREQVERVYRNRITEGSDAGDLQQALNFKLSILNELINNQILAAHAARAGIALSEAEVDTKIRELESPYSPEEFQRKLTDQGTDVNSLRQEIRQNLIINKLLNQEIKSRISVSESEVAAYYERNKANFNLPETQYHLAQIEVTPGPSPGVRNLKNDKAKNPRSAELKIDALYARLRSGDDFGVVAQEYSEDPKTASGGGDLGFIPASSLDANPPLKQLVTSLKVGQVSGILRTSSGYHIVKLLGREEAGQRPLSDPTVQSTIRQNLMNEKEQLLKAAYLEDLRNRAEVVNHLAEQVVAAGANAFPQK